MWSNAVVTTTDDEAAHYRAMGWWGDTTLDQRVRELAATRPDDVAISGGDPLGTITWAEYDIVADRYASRLHSLARGSRVLVWVPDSAQVHAAYLGCERAGMVAVGVGWRAGRRELEHLVRATGARTAILPFDTPAGPAAEVAAGLDLDAWYVIEDDVDIDGDDAPARGAEIGTAARAGAVTGIDGHAGGGAERPAAQPIGPDELWFVNSTSGTTGLPKCVMQTFNRWHYFHTKAVAFGRLGPNEVWMSVVPSPFGFGLWTAHVTPVLLGVPCHVQARFDAAAAARTIERERVTVLCATSSQFVMILDAADGRDLTSLRVLFTGGEAISPSRAREFERVTGCTVLNFYGSNETGMLSGTRVGDPLEQRVTTGGQVVPEMQVRLYDDSGRRRIDGDRGEGRPACRGPALSPGYLDDPAANAQLFTDDGWMLMGDRVRIDADGWLTVIGRTADLIIRGGKNLSAPAIEDEVAAHPAVRLAAAVPVPDRRLGEKVGVFVELRADTEPLDLDGLRAHLDARGVGREWWPEYLWVLDSLPRSSGGKVAKGELRARAAEITGTPPADLPRSLPTTVADGRADDEPRSLPTSIADDRAVDRPPGGTAGSGVEQPG